MDLETIFFAYFALYYQTALSRLENNNQEILRQLEYMNSRLANIVDEKSSQHRPSTTDCAVGEKQEETKHTKMGQISITSEEDQSQPDVSKDIQMLKTENEELQTKNAVLEQQNNYMNEGPRTLKSQVEEQPRKNGELQQMNTDLKSNAEDRELNIEDLEIEGNEGQQKIQELEAKIPTMTQESSKPEDNNVEQLNENNHKHSQKATSAEMELFYDCFGKKVLHKAAEDGDLEEVKWLLDSGDDVSRTNDLGMTPLHFACKMGHLSVAKLLIERGADVDIGDDKGVTPLHLAVGIDHRPVSPVSPSSDPTYRGHLSVVQLLIEKGANVNLADENGRTLLHIACMNDQVSLAEMLISAGAELNKFDKPTYGDHCTPLHHACQRNNLRMAHLLLKSGADICLTRQQKLGPFSLITNRQSEFRELFKNF